MWFSSFFLQTSTNRLHFKAFPPDGLFSNNRIILCRLLPSTCPGVASFSMLPWLLYNQITLSWMAGETAPLCLQRLQKQNNNWRRSDSRQNKRFWCFMSCISWIWICMRCFHWASYIIMHKAKLPLQPRNKTGHANIFFSPDWCVYHRIHWGKGLTNVCSPLSLPPKSSFASTWVSLEQECAVHSPSQSTQLESRGRHCCDRIHPQSAGVHIQLQRRPTQTLSGLTLHIMNL